MKSKQSLKIVKTLIFLAVTTPIWYYLLYKILTMIGASELMMFLFWVYVPVGIFVGILGSIIDAMED